MIQLTATNLKTQEQENGLLLIKEQMANEGVPPDSKGGYSHGAAIRYMLEKANMLFTGKNKPGRHATGPGDAVINRIHECVQNQMEINRTTTDTIDVGNGKNTVSVLYRQRAITKSWIRSVAGVNLQAINEYLSAHSADVNEHNNWLLKITGANDLENFNRRTSKAHNRAKVENMEEI